MCSNLGDTPKVKSEGMLSIVCKFLQCLGHILPHTHRHRFLLDDITMKYHIVYIACQFIGDAGGWEVAGVGEGGEGKLAKRCIVNLEIQPQFLDEGL